MREHSASARDVRDEISEPIASSELPKLELREPATGRRCAAALFDALRGHTQVSGSVVFVAATLRRHIAARMAAVAAERHRADPLVAADFRRIDWHLRQLDAVAERVEEALGNVVVSGGVLGELEQAVLAAMVESVASGLAAQLDREHEATMREHWEDIGGG